MTRTLRMALLSVISAVALLVSLAAQASPANAATSAIIDNCDPTKLSQLQFVQCVGNAEIARRVTVLNALTTKVNALIQKIQSSSTVDQTIIADLQGIVSDANANLNGGTTFGVQVAGLTALKTQLDAETTVAAARTDVHNIYAQYRIYLLVLPRDYTQTWLFNLMWAYEIENNLVPVLQKLESNPPTTPQQTEIAKLQALLADANTQIQAATPLFGSATLTLTNFNEANADATLHQIRGFLAKAHKDVNDGAFVINHFCSQNNCSGA